MSVKLRKKKLSSGNTSLYLDIYKDGVRSYEFLKIYLTKNKELNKENLKLAQSIRSKREIEINHSEHGFVPAFKKKINYVKYFESLITSRTYPRNWDSTLKHIKNYSKGFVKISLIDSKWIEGIQQYLLKKVSQNVAFHYYGIIRASFNQAIKDKLIINNPCINAPKMKQNQVARTYLTYDEVTKISKVDFKFPEIKKAFLFSCFSGLRYSDIVNLTWGDIKKEDNHYKLAYKQTKTKTFEYMPLSKTAINLINKDSKNIINFPKNKIFKLPSYSWVYVKLKELGKQAGLKKVLTTHVGRHTFATLSITNGVDIYRVSKLLGHKNLNHTEIYAKIINEKLQQAVDMLPELEVK